MWVPNAASSLFKVIIACQTNGATALTKDLCESFDVCSVAYAHDVLFGPMDQDDEGCRLKNL